MNLSTKIKIFFEKTWRDVTIKRNLINVSSVQTNSCIRYIWVVILNTFFLHFYISKIIFINKIHIISYSSSEYVISSKLLVTRYETIK